MEFRGELKISLERIALGIENVHLVNQVERGTSVCVTFLPSLPPFY